MRKIIFALLLAVLFVVSASAQEVSFIEEERSVNLSEQGISSFQDATLDSIAYTECSSNGVVADSEENNIVKVLELDSNETSSYESNIPCDVGEVGLTSEYVYLSYDGELKYAVRGQDSSFQTFIENKMYDRDENGVIVWEENNYYTAPDSEPVSVDLSNVDISAERDQQQATWNALTFSGKFIHYNAGVDRYRSYGRVVKDTGEGRSYYLNLETGEDQYLNENIQETAESRIITEQNTIYNTETGETSGKITTPDACQEIEYATEEGLWMKYNEDDTELTQSGTSGYCFYNFDENNTYIYNQKYAGQIAYASGERAITEGYESRYAKEPVTAFTVGTVDGKNYCSTLEINSNTTCSVNQVSCECQLNTTELEENHTVSISEDKQESIEYLENKYNDLKNRSQEIIQEQEESSSPAWMMLKFHFQNFLSWF